MTVSALLAKTDLRTVTLPDGDREITGVYIGDLLSWVMGRARSGDAWITIMSNNNSIAVASLADAACIILAEGVTLDEDVRAIAEAKDINVLSSDKTAYEIAVELNKVLS